MAVFPAAVEEAVNRKDDPLLALLKSVYVDSTDPEPAEVRRGHRDMLGSFLLSQTTDTLNCLQNSSRDKHILLYFYLFIIISCKMLDMWSRMQRITNI